MPRGVDRPTACLAPPLLVASVACITAVSVGGEASRPAIFGAYRITHDPNYGAQKACLQLAAWLFHVARPGLVTLSSSTLQRIPGMWQR